MVDCDGNQATLELNLVPIAIDNKIIEIKIAMFSYKEGSHMHLLHRTTNKERWKFNILVSINNHCDHGVIVINKFSLQ